MDSTATVVANSDNKLVILLNILPFQDMVRFFVHLNVLGAVQLQGCCRLLRNKIATDNSFWRQLYRAKFLSGPYIKKEWDFVFWCSRTGFSANIASSTSTSGILNALNWYDTYRRRVCTERNWRNGHSEYTVIPLSCPDDFKAWDRFGACATGVLLEYRACNRHSLRTFAAVEPTGHHAMTHSFNSDTRHMSQPSALVEFKLSGKYTKIGYMETQMNDRFVVVLIEHPDNNIKTMEIRNRGTLELRLSRQIPYLSELKAISGRWALLIYTYWLDVSLEGRYVVWDLESGTACPGHIEVQESRDWCIHKVDEKYATVYTTMRKIDVNNAHEWALYQFSLDGPVKQLKRGR
jgi:hypothetical protein